MARSSSSKMTCSALSVEDGVALAIATLASLICIQAGWFDYVCMMLRREEQYELDEYVGTSFIFLTIAFIMFARREWQLRTRLTASNKREQTARAVARKDHLTGLPNRLALMERMEEVRAEHVVFLLMDLDGFKAINDRHGHAAGDEVLKEVSNRLQGIAAGVYGSLVARLGGDEFGCLLTKSSGPEELAVRQEIISCLEEPIHLTSGTVRVGASIGSAASIDGQFSPDELLHLSDTHMYDEKIRRFTVRRSPRSN